MSVRDVITATLVVPTARERGEVQALVGAGEPPSRTRPGAEKGAGLLLALAAVLLSANPAEDEPIEDAFGGVVQNLASAHVF
jgi:hypothetical protein